MTALSGFPAAGLTRKGVLARAASLTGAGLALAGCAVGAPSGDSAGPVRVTAPTTVELGHYFGQGPRWDLIQAAAKKLEQETAQLKVEIQPVADSAGYWQAITTRLAGGTAPSIIIGSGSTFPDLLDKGAWHGIDSYLKRDRAVDLRLYYGDASSGVEHEGKHYGLPFMISTTIVCFNKAAFKRAGLPDPAQRWTWDDLVDAARKLTDAPDPEAPDTRWGVNLVTSISQDLIGLIRSAGGEEISKDLKKTTMEDPRTVEAVQWVADLYLRHRVAPPSGTRFTPSDFVSGRLAIRFTNSAGIGSTYLPSIGDNFEWDVTWLPRHPRTGKQTGIFVGNPFMLVNAPVTTMKNPDAGWLLLRHMASPYVQGLIAESKIQVPTLISAATEKATYLKPPPASMHLTHELMKLAEPFRFPKAWTPWSAAVTRALAPVFTGQKALRDALADANAQGDAALRGG